MATGWSNISATIMIMLHTPHANACSVTLAYIKNNCVWFAQPNNPDTGSVGRNIVHVL